MRFAFRLMTAAAVFFAAAPAFAQSSKAAWRFKEVISLSAGTGGTTDTGWVDVLRTHIKTPNAKELAIGVSLQCGLVTDTTVRSLNGDKDASAARSKIAVRVKIVQPDDSVVYAEPDNGGDLTFDPADPMAILLGSEGVTYCDRYQMLAARFSGLNCTADLLNGGVVTCEDPEELQLILKTLNANHFEFLHANAVPGVQEVVVQARAQAGMVLGGTELGDANAEAFVGAGAMSVETIRLIKDASGTTDLENLH